jgi:3-oxoacyl-[acyl-carrier protein] reductase
MIDPRLAGKVALVTGANHGIGAATALALAEQGAAVFATYLRLPLPEGEAGDPSVPGRARYRACQAQGIERTLEAIRRGGGRAAAWEADLADPTVIPEVFDRAEAALGPVSVLVNNAAHCVPDTFTPPDRLGPGAVSAGGATMTAITAESHDRHAAINSRAPALLMAELARRHVSRGATWGRIVVLSTDGASGFPGEVSYGASKHALESYSRAAATELRPYGITVNAVAPGPIQTGWASPEAARMQPFLGRPEDVADVIVFLASHQARWLTGQLLYVGNGLRMPL